MSNAVGSGLIRGQVGEPAAACKTSKERIRTTGPPVALCRLTTHADSSSTVCFAYGRQSVLRGVRGIVSGQNWQRVPLGFGNCHTPESVPGSQQKVCASALRWGLGALCNRQAPGVFGSRLTTQNQMRSVKPRMLSHTVRREIQSRGLGPVCLVSDWVLPKSPAGHAGYAAERMCL